MIGMLCASPRFQFDLILLKIFPLRAFHRATVQHATKLSGSSYLEDRFLWAGLSAALWGGSSAGCKHRARRPEEGSDSLSTPTKHCLKFNPLMMSSFVLIHFLDIVCACIPPDANNNQKKSQTDKPPATTIVVKKFVLKLRKSPWGSYWNSENPLEDPIET